jgi:hypothetical protein
MSQTKPRLKQHERPIVLAQQLRESPGSDWHRLIIAALSDLISDVAESFLVAFVPVVRGGAAQEDRLVTIGATIHQEIMRMAGPWSFEASRHAVEQALRDARPNEPVPDTRREMAFAAAWCQAMGWPPGTEREWLDSNRSKLRPAIAALGTIESPVSEAVPKELELLAPIAGAVAALRKDTARIIALLERTPENSARVKAMATQITEMEFSIRVRNCLGNNKITHAGQLTELTAKELRRIPNIGRVSVNEIRQELARLGLSLKGEP